MSFEQPKSFSLDALVDYNGRPIGLKPDFTEFLGKTYAGLSSEDIDDALELKRLGGLIGRQDKEVLAREMGIEGVTADTLGALAAGSMSAAADARHRLPNDKIAEKIAAYFGTSLQELRS